MYTYCRVRTMLAVSRVFVPNPTFTLFESPSTPEKKVWLSKNAPLCLSARL